MLPRLGKTGNTSETLRTRGSPRLFSDLNMALVALCSRDAACSQEKPEANVAAIVLFVHRWQSVLRIVYTVHK